MGGVIYILSDPRDGQPRYVGKALHGVKARLAVHMAPSHLKCRTYKAAWLRSLVVLGLRPVLEIIEETNDTEEAERFWIGQLRGLGFRLTNLTDGGDGRPGFKPAPSVAAKIAASNRGKKRTVEQRQRMSIAQRGIKKPRSRQHAIAMSRANGGQPFMDESGRIYQTYREAESVLGLSGGTVSRVLSGKIRRSRYIFRFIDG